MRHPDDLVNKLDRMLEDMSDVEFNEFITEIDSQDYKIPDMLTNKQDARIIKHLIREGVWWNSLMDDEVDDTEDYRRMMRTRN